MHVAWFLGEDTGIYEWEAALVPVVIRGHGYRATWIYDRLRRMGFSGSYEIVKTAAHGIKEEGQRMAYMRFETDPGYRSQVEIGEFQFEGADTLMGFALHDGSSHRLPRLIPPG